jgi:hypothetical protein
MSAMLIRNVRILPPRGGAGHERGNEWARGFPLGKAPSAPNRKRSSLKLAVALSTTSS